MMIKTFGHVAIKFTFPNLARQLVKHMFFRYLRLEHTNLDYTFTVP